MLNDQSWEQHQALKRAERRLAFMQRLQEVGHALHLATDLDEIMLDLARDIRALFGCDRLTLYAVTPSRTTIKSRVKTGMDSFKDFELPVSTSSIAGFCALHKRLMNLRDVYDEAELQSHSSELRFLDKVDRRTGYRSREMIVAPIVNERNGELLGVLQLINNRLGGPFSDLVEEGTRELCKTLALNFERHLREIPAVVTRFDPLVELGSLAAAELELAKRSARRKHADLEDVLLDDFQVTQAELGEAYARFFGVSYAPFDPDAPPPPAMYQLKRAYAEHNHWLVLGERSGTVTVVALQPDRLRANRTVENLYPGVAIDLRVTTRREFGAMLDRVFGAPMDVTADPAADAALAERIVKIVAEALAEQLPELSPTVALGEARPAEENDPVSRLQLSIELRQR